MANEKRLIDANAVREQFAERYDDAFMQIVTRTNKEYWKGYATGINWGRSTITDAHTVDAVEVVLCKDCKYWTHMEDGMGDCTNGAFHLDGCPDPTMAFNDYCSRGERREGE